MTALKNRSAFAASVAGKGVSVEAIEGMPPGWLASLYSMPEKRFMAAALADLHNRSFSCRVRMHFERTGRRAPVEAMRSLADGFRLHDSGRAPWEVFDSAFECAAAFKLVRTAFQAGSRLFVLEWRMRRLFIWFFSLAGQALKDKVLENWCAEYLNHARCFPARRFAPGEGGLLRTEHKRAFPLGHIDEIARRCFSYESGCRLLPEANQIVLYVFNYRRREDVAALDLRLPGAA